MKRILTILTLLLFCQSILVIASETQRDARTVEDVLLKLKEREATLVTFMAGFKQIQKNSLLAQPLVSEGRLYYDQKGKLLMKMTTPEAYLVLITDQKMIIGTPGTPSYRQKKLPGQNAFFKQVMGIGQSVQQLKNKYDIRMVDAHSRESCELELKPLKKSRRTPFAVIRARINTLQWLPEMIRLEETGNDVTTFHLQFISINRPLPTGIFDIPLPDKNTPLNAGKHDIK